jgi:hypothetical protein
MRDTTPVCHASLARGDSRQPWDLEITVGYVEVDGLSHTDSFTVSTADLLVHHLTVLGINTLHNISPVPEAELPAEQTATPAEIVAAVEAGSDLATLSLVAAGVSGSEMAWRVSALRELEN